MIGKALQPFTLDLHQSTHAPDHVAIRASAVGVVAQMRDEFREKDMGFVAAAGTRAQRMRRLASDFRRGTGATSTQRDAEHSGLPLAGFAATRRQRTGDPAVAVLHAQFAATVLRERHRRLRNDRNASPGAVFVATLAAVGGVEGMADVPGEGLDGKRLDIEIALVPARGEAGRTIDSTLRVAAAVTERGQHGRRKLLAHGAIAGTSVERRAYFGEAAAMSADCNASGSALWRFVARRNIPAHAVELKKYRGGIEVVSSTCDNNTRLRRWARPKY